MALTPEEIVAYEVERQSVRGYSTRQVDDLLDQLADQIEAGEREREELAARLREANDRLEASQETEATLKRTLVTAQQTVDRAVADAQQEADDLLARARADAEEITAAAEQEAEQLLARTRERVARELEEARRQRGALEARIDELRTREREHRARLRASLEQQLAELDEPIEDAAGDPGLEDDGGEPDPVEATSPGGDVEEPEPWSQPTGANRPGEGGLRVRVHDSEQDSDPSAPLASRPPRDDA